MKMQYAPAHYLAAAGALALAAGAHAQESSEELAKKLSNPVAAMISVPLQYNYDQKYGDERTGHKSYLNVQPVIPFSISPEWNMISRTIVPLIDQNTPGINQSGVGDITQSLFFSPKAPTQSGWIWGVGPAFLLPTASENALGTEQWAIGPTAVVLKQTDDGLTYGALVNYLVSVAGDDDRADVNAMFMQPFLAKGLGKGRTATVNFESTYDFEAEQWNVPLNLMYSQVTKVGGQMVSFAVGARAYLDSPIGGPDWGVRFVVTLLYPR